MAEVAVCDQANQCLRLKTAKLTGPENSGRLQTVASTIPMATFNCVASVEWVRARENVLLVERVRHRQAPTF
jgi:hypothetical protein